ncbi:hypothetical protein DL95DRAFT_489720, partial [Leptodontidium sp. 2 PMI_412]
MWQSLRDLDLYHDRCCEVGDVVVRWELGVSVLVLAFTAMSITSFNPAGHQPREFL